MKRFLFVLALLLVFSTTVSAQIVARTYLDSRAQNGELASVVTVTWSLVTLEADTDSSIATIPVLLCGTQRAPVLVVVKFAATAMVGGGSTSSLALRPMPVVDSADPDPFTYLYTPMIYSGIMSATAIYPYVYPVATLGAANQQTMFMQGATNIPLQVVPPWCIFMLDKEGNGKFTAGTVVLTIYSYAR